MLKSNLRDPIAAIFRALPYFRGKYRLAPGLLPLMTDYQNEQDCLVDIKLRDGGLMRIDLRSFTEQRAFFAGDYDGGVLKRFASILNSDSVVLDVGANVGFYSIALGRRLQQLGNGKLWAVEPVPTNYDRLLYNIRLNHLEDVVFPLQTALGNHTGTIPLHLGKGTDNLATTGNAFICQGNTATEIAPNCSAPITTLDALAQTHNITSCTFIKVDIEGAELDFLQGGQKLLARCRPIIYGEFSPYWCQEFGYSFLDVATLFSEWDYRFYQQVGRARFVQVKAITPELQDVLLVPQETSAEILAKLGASN
ncbi:FkbM family methyltransferase [Leptolyngbya sp. FACHB-17]|uniref:FkbM family methyltransferase n=1 Tax=unclassified Leptolyngbya TaxID=2650499 RepID=UPI0016800A65|nr:FkbM family methyltransferase [Leptolyngbya sp. FACHB-17]